MRKSPFHFKNKYPSAGKFRPFRRVSRQKGLLKKPDKMFYAFLLSALFVTVAFILTQFPSILPKFQGRKTEIVSPQVSASSLGVFNAALKAKNIQFDTMKTATESPTLVVFLSNGGYAYLDLNTDAQAQVLLLSRILSRVGIDSPSKKIKYIDLRHEKAVIGFQSP